MDSVRVTPEILRNQAKKVDDEAESYYGEYNNLLKDVETLTESDWKGDDADKFREKVRGFEHDFSRMKGLMNDYATYLRQAADAYESRQDNTINAINSVR